MRKRLYPFALFTLLSGCSDLPTFGSDCRAEQTQVRLQEGTPTDVQSGELAGNYTEKWYYFSPNRSYTFRWGVSHESCEVEGPSRFVRLPL